MNKARLKYRIANRGLENRDWMGTVVDIVDPEKRSRIKVEIANLTEGLKPEQLPWYHIKQPVNNGNTNTTIPPLNSRVIVSFINDDIYNGMVNYQVPSIPPR